MSDPYLTNFYDYYFPGLEFLNGETLYKQYGEPGGVDGILNFHTPVVCGHGGGDTTSGTKQTMHIKSRGRQ